MSTKKKKSIDLNILDFKQMFDSEELTNVLNAFYDAGVKDDMFAIVNEANKSVKFAVRTPTGLTDIRSIENKIMQGDVLSPLMSSNMVDKNVVDPAVSTRCVYMYKNKVEIPPLIMQDDTLSVSECGVKTIKINNLINTRTKSMGLQFGPDKCVKMHIGKNENYGTCADCKVDNWKETIIKHKSEHDELKDEYVGEELMKLVHEKNTLGIFFLTI